MMLPRLIQPYETPKPITEMSEAFMSAFQNTTPAPQPLLLRIEEAAHLLGLGRSTVYELLYKGEIPSVRIGTSRRIPFAALSQWITDHTEYGQPE